MASNERDSYLELRHGTRDLLRTIGILSNPAVGDEWIVNQLRGKAKLPLIENYDEQPEDDFTLFKNSLAKIVTELGKQLPEPDERGSVLESRRLVRILTELYF